MKNRAGYLFIVGGGYRPKYMMEEFVRLSGGSKAKIVIIPSASRHPVEAAMLMKREFAALGVEDVDFVDYPPDQEDESHGLRIIQGATGIFISGGDQNKLATKYLGTKLLDEIRKLYLQGAVIGGTSAGAAIMSRVMLTTFGPDDSDHTATLELETSRAALSAGFGFLENIIIDQHFNTRPRHQRLMNAVLKHKDKTGMGIDESTAVIFRPDNSYEVLGENKVTLYKYSPVSSEDVGLQESFAVEIIRSGSRKHLPAVHTS